MITPNNSQFQAIPSGRFRMELILSEKKRNPTRTTAETEMVMIPNRFLRSVSLMELINVQYAPFQQDPKAANRLLNRGLLCDIHSIIKDNNLQRVICKFSQAHSNPCNSPSFLSISGKLLYTVRRTFLKLPKFPLHRKLLTASIIANFLVNEKGNIQFLSFQFCNICTKNDGD